MKETLTREQLNKVDKDVLVTMILSMGKQLAEQTELIKLLKHEIELLSEKLSLSNTRQFSPSTEAGLTDDQQLSIYDMGFNEAEALMEGPVTDEPDMEEVISYRRKKKTGKRDEDLSGFPVEEIPHPIEEEKLAELFPDGYCRLPDEVYRKLEIIPSTFRVLEHHIHVYKGKDGRIVKADHPKEMLNNSIATPSLVAAIINAKYVNALPLYRQEQEYRRNDVNISRQTMANWVITAAERYLSLITDRLQAELENYGKRKASAQGRIEAAKEAVGDRERPKTEELVKALEEAEDALAGSQKVLEQNRTHLRADSEVLKALTAQQEERSSVVTEHTRLESLYSRLSGKVPGARMDIETYVQRYYLERILAAANRRFREMSAGQFELRMYDIDKAGEGRNRGLDLMVYSEVTGKEREVRTLSGGESFMAALSLALGMADQIQASSAAINLDVMFIDEGFGSLDDHARSQAVKVLQRMAGGAKLIGIISHVTELKNEMEDQLLVTKDEHGSRVRWQIS